MKKELLVKVLAPPRLWEDVDEAGFLVEWGYSYETPLGKITTICFDGGGEVVAAPEQFAGARLEWRPGDEFLKIKEVER